MTLDPYRTPSDVAVETGTSKLRLARYVGRLLLVVALLPLLNAAFGIYMLVTSGTWPKSSTPSDQAAMDHAFMVLLTGSIVFLAISASFALLGWGLINDQWKSQIFGAIGAVMFIAVYVIQFR